MGQIRLLLGHRKSRRYVATVALLGLAGGLLLWVFLTAQTTPPGPVVSSTSLEGVDLEDVLEVRVLPADVRPKVSRQVAEQVALDNARYTSLRDAVFARVATSIFQGPAWIVSLNPGDWAAPGPGGGVVEYLIVIVDAETGDFILGQSSTAAPPGGWAEDSGGPPPAPQPLSAPARIGQ